MRLVLYVFGGLMIVAASFWAYSITYATQDRFDDIARLNRAIAKEREAIQVLRAEWAWMNSPDRLKRLIAANGEELGLGPMEPPRFAELYEAPMKQPDDGLSPVAIVEAVKELHPETVAPKPTQAKPSKPKPAPAKPAAKKPAPAKPVISAEAREAAPRRAPVTPRPAPVTVQPRVAPAPAATYIPPNVARSRETKPKRVDR